MGTGFVRIEQQPTQLYGCERLCSPCVRIRFRAEACAHSMGVPQSVLARGLHALLPPIEVVKQSYCNADPEEPREWEARPVAASARMHGGSLSWRSERCCGDSGNRVGARIYCHVRPLEL